MSTIGATSALIGAFSFLGGGLVSADTTQTSDVASVAQATALSTDDTASTDSSNEIIEQSAESDIATESTSIETTETSDATITEDNTVNVKSDSTSEIQENTAEITNEATAPEAKTELSIREAATNETAAPQVTDNKDYSSFSTTNYVADTGLTELANELAKDAGINVAELTSEQVAALNKLYVKDTQTGSQMTYKDFTNIANSLISQDSQYAIPYFKASVIENMKAATTKDAQTGEVADLDVWDSWPVQDIETGYVSNWNGYQLVVAMMGVPNTNDNHLYLLYNNYGDNVFQNWKNAGSIFGYGLDAVTQQWSGSAVVNSDGTVQLFYTNVDTSDNNSNNQMLASATLNLAVEDGKVVLKSVDNQKILTPTGGDGYYYQSYAQWRSTFTGADNIAMRDPHVVQDENGIRYLVFEASTGSQNYQDENQIYNVKNYGGDAKFILSSLFDIIGNEDMYTRASFANAAIGIVQLGGNEKSPTIENYLTPLVSSTMVSDEIERPNVVKLGDKYYLFAASRLNHGSNDYAWQEANKVVGDNVVMLGWVSDTLTEGYKPLNGSSVILTASVPADWRTATYSYYAVPFEGSNDTLLVTSYMTNRNSVAGVGNNSTWGPSFLIQILPDGTTRVLDKMTNQGDWIWDDTSETLYTKGNRETAHLPGEDDGVVEGNPGGYNLLPHVPVTPTPPDKPSVPTTPDTPTPEEPKTPTPPSKDIPGRGQGKLKNTPVVGASVLPATGEANTSVAAALGFVIMASMISYVAYSGYKRKL